MKLSGKFLAYAIIITATIADAISDGIMIKMFGAMDWTAVQWQWHIAKWLSFFLTAGYVAFKNLSLKAVALLAVICYVLWIISYDLVTL